MKQNLTNYLKMNLKSFLVLIYIKTLRLYSLNELSIFNFDKEWFKSVFGTLIAITLNSLVGDKITKQIIKVYDEKEEVARDTISTSLSVLYVLVFKYLYYIIFFQKNILDLKYFQLTIISILSITFYSITMKPFFSNSHNSRFFNSIIQDTILLLSSDFVSDAQIDNSIFDIEINSLGTLFRIIVNSLITI